MVATAVNPETARLFDLLGSVVDPEIPVLTLLDLGVLRDVSVADGTVHVTITPTYAGCPAMQAMREDIESTLAAAGYTQVVVRQRLSPAWSTDWMTQDGREKLRAYGIAPPLSTTCNTPEGQIECPQCRSTEVRKISEFGSTACKALYQCEDCREPFDYFKCL
ncbi:MAG: 1,2-phenylacetyl-CoA epoxidase subunit PaaD [Lysobacterales bacterium]